MAAPAASQVQVLDPDELGAWLRLLHTGGVGRETARKLLAAFGAPQAVLDAPRAARARVVGAAAAAALDTPPEAHDQRLRKTLAWLAAAPQRRVMVLGQTDYPHWLLQTADPPLLMYLEGRAELLHAPTLAIVGSRRPTPQGAENARAFGAELSARGWAIASGLATGVDGAAHEGALSGPGSTIAVVGTGLDTVYPRSHRALAARIVEHGLMLSELALETAPLPAHFPQRNRIIAGLSRGTLVVEAALQSGSLITARLASEAGREVFAIPGSIHAPQSKGCHALIRQGAKLVETAAHILEELGPVLPPALPTDSADSAASARPDAPADDAVLTALGHDPASLDVLMARTGWPTHLLNAQLLTLELDGQIARLPGGLYQRITRS